MSISVREAASRPTAVAEGLLGHRVDEASVYSRCVVLTADNAALATANGRWCFMDALALLSRVVGPLIVALPREAADMRNRVDAYRARAWTRGSVRIADASDSDVFQNAYAILNVGSDVRTTLPWTSINSNGWVARISSNAPLQLDIGESNPIAALMAASLGVMETFKRVFDIPYETAPLLEQTEFSIYDLATAPDTLGPPLPDRIQLPDTLLTGAGAIGNGIALLLGQLPVQGRLHVVDKQLYEEPNLGTCLLADAIDWLGRPKAERLSIWLNHNSQLSTTGTQTTIEAAIAENCFNNLAIDLVVNGLDSADARRATQRLWPAVIVDGGINEVGAAVVQHQLDDPASACLMCWFEERRGDERDVQSRWTGLSAEAIQDMSRPLSDADIDAARPEKREWLRECQRQRKTICSVINEAQLASRFGIEVEEGFRPSAPFVATAAAALVMAAVVKAIVYRRATGSLFQLGNLFIGPDCSMSATRVPRDVCPCVAHRRIIEQTRANRLSRVALR